MFRNILLDGCVGAIVNYRSGSAYNYPEWIKLAMGQFAIYDSEDFLEGAFIAPQKPEAATKVPAPVAKPLGVPHGAMLVRVPVD